MAPSSPRRRCPASTPKSKRRPGSIYGDNVFRRNGDLVRLDYVYATDGNFLDVLKLPLVRGDPAAALASVDNVVLTETAARRLFGSIDVLGTHAHPHRDRRRQGNAGRRRASRHSGKLASADRGDLSRQYRLRRPRSRNVHTLEQYRRLGLCAPAALRRRRGDERANGGRAATRGAIHGPGSHGGGPARLHRRVRQRSRHQHRPGRFRDDAARNADEDARHVRDRRRVSASRRLRQLHQPRHRPGQPARPRGRPSQDPGRDPRTAHSQFLLEAMVTAAAAGLLALAMVELAMPMLNGLLRSGIQIRYFTADGVVLPLALLLCAIGVLGGVYPAFFLSRYRPSVVLKANQSGAETPGTGRLRAALVVLQFAVSIALIICTAIIYTQTLFAPLGRSRLQGLRAAVRDKARADRRPDPGRNLHASDRRDPGRDLGRSRRHHAQSQQHVDLHLPGPGRDRKRRRTGRRRRRQHLPDPRHAAARRAKRHRPEGSRRRRSALRSGRRAGRGDRTAGNSTSSSAKAPPACSASPHRSRRSAGRSFPIRMTAARRRRSRWSAW